MLGTAQIIVLFNIVNGIFNIRSVLAKWISKAERKWSRGNLHRTCKQLVIHITQTHVNIVTKLMAALSECRTAKRAHLRALSPSLVLQECNSSLHLLECCFIQTGNPESAKRQQTSIPIWDWSSLRMKSLSRACKKALHSSGKREGTGRQERASPTASGSLMANLASLPMPPEPVLTVLLTHQDLWDECWGISQNLPHV